MDNKFIDIATIPVYDEKREKFIFFYKFDIEKQCFLGKVIYLKKLKELGFGINFVDEEIDLFEGYMPCFPDLEIKDIDNEDELFTAIVFMMYELDIKIMAWLEVWMYKYLSKYNDY